jgi:hypothetical protein
LEKSPKAQPQAAVGARSIEVDNAMLGRENAHKSKNLKGVYANDTM